MVLAARAAVTQGKGSVLAAKAAETQRQRQRLSREGSGNTKGKGSVLAARAAETHGKAAVLAATAAEAQEKAAVLAAKAAATQGKGSVLLAAAFRIFSCGGHPSPSPAREGRRRGSRGLSEHLLLAPLHFCQRPLSSLLLFLPEGRAVCLHSNAYQRLTTSTSALLSALCPAFLSPVLQPAFLARRPDRF